MIWNLDLASTRSNHHHHDYWLHLCAQAGSGLFSSTSTSSSRTTHNRPSSVRTFLTSGSISSSLLRRTSSRCLSTHLQLRSQWPIYFVYGGLYDVKDGENVDNDFHNSDDGEDVSEKITACAKSIPPRVPVLMEAAFPPRICACGWIRWSWLLSFHFSNTVDPLAT